MSVKKGIDVSKYQGVINWASVKSSGKVDFAILRAGFGREISQKDSTFEANYAGCKKHNIPCGVYWYSYASSEQDAVREAKTCLEAIKGKKFEYPIYFDVEESFQFQLGRAKVSAIIKAFLDYVEKAGYWVGLYMSKYYLETYVTEDIRKRYAIWLAQYSSSCTYGGQYGIWQYGVAGDNKYDTFNVKSISGINANCDCDYCYVDYPTLIKKAGLNGYTKTTTSGSTSSGTISNTPQKKDEYTVYTVVKGDSLWGIAQKILKNGSRYPEIKNLNGLTSNIIYPGMKLKVPKY